MYKLLLCWRYFRSRFLALAAFLAITFGVAMLLIVLGIMGGYLLKLQEHIRGQEAHLQVLGPGQYGVTRIAELEEVIADVPGVLATSPFIERLAVYRTPMSFNPCQLTGVDPVRQARVGTLARFVLRPSELGEIHEEFLRIPKAGEEPPPPPDRTQATARIHQILTRPGREDLSPEELERFYSLEWRDEVLRTRFPRVHESLDGDLPPAVLVGVQLLLERRIFLGQIITVVTLSPDDETPEPISQDFVVVGAVKTGDFDQDSGTLYAEIGLVKNMLGLWQELPDGDFVYRYQGVRVALEPEQDLETVRLAVEQAVRAEFPQLSVKTWRELRRNLLKAVQIEKFLVYFLVLILVVFTGSMILLMLLLAVIEKTRDIGVLLSLGATPHGVTTIFLLNGLTICIVGTLAGFGLGLAFCGSINEIHDAIYELTGWRLFKAEIYHMDRIPIAFEPLDVVLSIVPPVVIGLLSSLVPALWAPRRDPIRAIQYE